MYGLLLTLVLTQALSPEEPRHEVSAVVLVERVVGLSPARAQTLAGDVARLLEREGIAIAEMPEQVEQRLRALGAPSVSSCQGQQPCLVQLGPALGATVVVLLKAKERKDILTINLEAVSTQEGTSLWKDLFLVATDSAEELEAGVVESARALRSVLSLPEPGTDAPVAHSPGSVIPKLELPVEKQEGERIALKPESPSPPPRRSRTLLYATGGGTLVALGTAVAFGLMGRGQKNRMDEAGFIDSETGSAASRLTRAEAEQVSGRANLYFTVALSSSVISAALGSTTAYLWLREGPPE